jgi:hypothetical protein
VPDLQSIRARHAANAAEYLDGPMGHAQFANLRIGWRSHQEIGWLLREIDRLQTIVDEPRYTDPRSHPFSERKPPD